METLTREKKITRATFKSFVNKNRENLYFIPKRSFDGMTDGIEEASDKSPKLAEVDLEGHLEHSLGVRGVWLVGESRDYFRSYEDDIYLGIECINCCGTFIVAIKK